MNARFEEEQAIGQGAMGQVHKALDPRLRRTVAVKTLLLDDESSKARFIREAQVTGSLEHPAVPPVYELGQHEDGTPYFALKLLEGETLEAVCQRLCDGDAATHAEYPFSRRLQICLRICEALEFAHAKNIIHRDLKPENVMLGHYGEVWLVDWGLAREPETAAGEARLTQENSFVGTPAFAAPEQIAGEANFKTDQYSFGALMYYLFTLQPPHPGKTAMEALTSLLNGNIKSAESFKHPIQGRVPREICRLIHRCLAREPEERFDNLNQVGAELQALVDGDVPAVCPHTTVKKGLTKLAHIIDNHGLWLGPILLVWLAYPLKDILGLIIDLISRAMAP
ncbi:MAG: serine/threonine-protein kinase [Vulcanimicrobiota bacterium]